MWSNEKNFVGRVHEEPFIWHKVNFFEDFETCQHCEKLQSIQPQNAHFQFWQLVLFVAHSFRSCSYFQFLSICYSRYFSSSKFLLSSRTFNELTASVVSAGPMWCKETAFCGNYRKKQQERENHSPFLHHNGFYTLVNKPDFIFIFYAAVDARSLNSLALIVVSTFYSNLLTLCVYLNIH